MFNSPIAVMKGVKIDFLRLLKTNPQAVLNKFTKEVQSKSNIEKYPIFLTLPGIREFLDEIGFGDSGMKKVEVTNHTYYSGFDMDFDTYDDSQETMGSAVKDIAKGMSDKYTVFRDQKIQALLEANPTIWDDTAFFSTTRSNLDTGDNVINNLMTGNGVDTFAHFTTDFVAAKAAMAAMKDKDNIPFNPVKDLVVLVPDHVEDLAETVLGAGSKRAYNGTAEIDNIYAGKAKIIVNPYQDAGDNDWYLINMNATYPPFFVQNRENLKWEYEKDKKHRKHEWWYTFRLGMALINPFAIIKINN